MTLVTGSKISQPIASACSRAYQQLLRPQLVQMAAESLLATERHRSHNVVWTVQGFSIPQFCIACATERLEDSRELVVHRRMILNEFVAQFDFKDRSELVKLLVADNTGRIIDHLSNVLLGKVIFALADCYYSFDNDYWWQLLLGVAKNSINNCVLLIQNILSPTHTKSIILLSTKLDWNVIEDIDKVYCEL